MKKIIISLFLISFSVVSLYGQQENKNVVKLGLFGLANKNLRFSYERLLTERRRGRRVRCR